MNSSKKSIPWVSLFWFILLLWIVEFVNLVTGNALLRFGISPRRISGLSGVLFAPFLHGSISHLLMNTVPLIVLGSLVLAHGRKTFFKITPIIIVFSGLGVWLLGRPAIHVGASSLIFGYFGFLVFRGFIKRSLVSMGISIFTIGVYGGIFWGIFPGVVGVSWEGHLFGFLAGLFCARRDV